MIRAGLIKEIHETLNSHQYSTLEDFKVEEFANKSQEPCLSIIYSKSSLIPSDRLFSSSIVFLILPDL